MESFRIKNRPSVEKDIRKVPRESVKYVLLRIESLADNPYPKDSKKLGGEEAYRIRVGNFRIVYTVHAKERIVMIERVKHRKDVYRKF